MSLLAFWAIASLVLGAGACVWPLDYQEQKTDAGCQNHTPVITAANPKMPGPITLDSATLGTPFSIDVRDADIGDTLYVRVFRDYTKDTPTPPFNDFWQTNDPDVGTDVRTIDLDNQTWCNGAQRDATLILDVMVADVAFADTRVEPFYRALTSGDEPGHSSISSWVAVCPSE